MNWGDFTHEHKNILTSAGVALVILLGGILFHERDNLFQPRASTPDAPENQIKAENISKGGDLTMLDDDNDNLPNWEEYLYGADPQKQDSDKDGTQDGEEVRLGRSPSKANTASKGKEPNDLLPVIQDPNFATSSTDLVGIKKEFFAKFLAAQGREIRETTFRDLIKKFDVKKYATSYQLVDLNISSDSSTEAVHTYINAFGVLIKKYTMRTHRTEDEILQAAMATKSQNTLKELQLPAIDYKNFAKDLIILQVPSALAQEHLKIVNGYDGMSKGLLGMQELFTNPIEGGGANQVFTARRLDVTNGYAGIVYYLGTHPDTFTSSESGYPFYFNALRIKVGTTTSKIMQ